MRLLSFVSVVGTTLLFSTLGKDAAANNTDVTPIDECPASYPDTFAKYWQHSIEDCWKPETIIELATLEPDMSLKKNQRGLTATDVIANRCRNQKGEATSDAKKAILALIKIWGDRFTLQQAINLSIKLNDVEYLRVTLETPRSEEGISQAVELVKEKHAELSGFFSGYGNLFWYMNKMLNEAGIEDLKRVAQACRNNMA